MYFVTVFFEDLWRSIAGSVVNHHNLFCLVALLQRGVHSIPDVRTLVMAGNDYAEARHVQASSDHAGRIAPGRHPQTRSVAGVAFLQTLRVPRRPKLSTRDS